MADDPTTTDAPALHRLHGTSPAHDMSDTTALPRHDSPAARRAFTRTLRPVRGRVIRACVCEGVGAAARLGVGFLAAGALTELVAGRTHDRGWWQAWLLVALAAVIVAWFGQWIGLLLAHRADNALQRTLRERLVDRIRASSLTWVDQHGSVLVKRIVAEDVDALHHLVGHALGHIAAVAVQTVLGLAGLLLIAAMPTLVALVPAATALLLARHQRRRLPAQMTRYQEASARVDRAGVEFVHGIAPLKIFGGIASGLQRFREAAAEYADFVSGWAACVTPSMVGQQVLLAAPAVWAALAVLALVTPVSAAQAAVVAIVLPLLLSPVESLAFAVQDLAGAVAASSRIDAVLADDSAADQTAQQAVEQPAHGGAEPAVRELVVREPAAQEAADWGAPVTVTLDDVGVRHGEHVALDGVSATLPAGGTTVLLGHSGSGKSTLLEVIAGLRPASVGAVRRSPADASVTALWQRPFLLRASVRDNVRLARPDATDAECLAAVTDAHVSARIEALDGGYDAIIGEQLALSGGEQQRLCLARALLARPRLLLLDEPTSAVDPTSARLIDDTLARLHGRTTIVRADHRPAVALTADLVLVLDAGRVVESGPPGHLLACGGRFARLVDDAARSFTQEVDS